MECHSGYRKHRLAIHLCVIKAVEKVNAPGARSRDATSQLTRELRISSRHESGSLFVPHLNEPDLVCVSS